MLNPALEDPAGAGERGSNDPKGGIVHAGECRCVGSSEPAAPVRLTGIIGRSLDRLDIAGLVNAQNVIKFRERNWGEHLDVVVLEESEFGHKTHSELHPDGREWMTGTEVVRPKPLVPDDSYPLAHRSGPGEFTTAIAGRLDGLPHDHLHPT